MTVYPYVPPAREYADTILAFKDFPPEAPGDKERRRFTWRHGHTPSIQCVNSRCRWLRDTCSPTMTPTRSLIGLRSTRHSCRSDRTAAGGYIKSPRRQQVRADLDNLAGRLGYHRDCGGDW